MQTLIINIKELLQVRETPIDKVSGSDMAVLPSIKNAFLLIEDDTIAAFGSMDNCPKINPEKTIDATGKWVPELSGTLTILTNALADDFGRLGLTICAAPA